MKNNPLKKININKERLKRIFQQALSPAFLVILLGSFLLWYTSKLGYEYTTEMPLNVRIDGERYKVTAIVNARGSTLMAQKLSLKGKINLKMDELSARPSADNPGSFTINKLSLQKAIDSKTSDLKIIEIIDAPDFEPVPAEETKEEKRKKKKAETESEAEPVPELTE